ncbi:hypothetical protein P4U99_27675, partial [Brevibacillus agri]|uniref:hypothetical protein n=1 Tax=Brevibacillus agri TaxID=51101 RepID=UPI002E2438FF|nr:hypothetical protein [Brevibacillus agri]MED1657483.1 hypothetical protein [Brevibacillus agri]MED1689928.1 hypothetical protein [Brevibacillus agri]MED1700880.1 hypothetical protein [Brevibacillus agri]MED1705241.1 hypothetical protein [Brevibacillus agri]
NSPIKFVAGSKLANLLMIDSSTLSPFSFQRAFHFLFSSAPRGADLLNYIIPSFKNQGLFLEVLSFFHSV